MTSINTKTTDKTEKLLAERTKLIEQNKRNETRIWNINLELAANKTKSPVGSND